MIALGDTVDRYVVEGELGRGGMASVYRVRHASLGSDHALKILHNVRSPKIRERLLREGRVQARLRHPNIVAVTDLVELGGEIALVLEYVPGESLHDLLTRGRPDPAEALRIFRGVLSGVERAHEAGLVHRDLKPANVLMDTNVRPAIPKVADFGLALVSEEGRITQSGNAMGTIPYMAPEQFLDAKNVDARADVYALGVMLYEMLTGEMPFEGGDMFAVLEAKRVGTYRPLGALARTHPTAALAIRYALAAEPADRLPDCVTMGEVLDGTIGEDELRRRVAARGADEPRRVTVPPRNEVTPRSAPTFADAVPSTLASRSPLSATIDRVPPTGRGVLVAIAAFGLVAVVVLGVTGAGLWYLLGGAGSPVPDAPAVAQDGPAPAPPVGPGSGGPAAGAAGSVGTLPAAPTPAASPSPGSSAATPPTSGSSAGTTGSASRPRAASEGSGGGKAAAPTTAVVRVDGVAEAWLVSTADESRPSMKKVPPGSYQVWARWAAGEDAFRARKVTVAAGEHVTVTCDATMRVCE